MKKPIAIAVFLGIATMATSTLALPNPYQGSDTLFNVTTQAIAAAITAGQIAASNASNYIGGGSGNAASAMAPTSASNDATATATQQTGPMSRMLKKEAGICSGFNSGTSGGAATNASGIVIGLDAVDVLSSTTAGGSAACNGTADNSDTGLIHSGSPAGTFGFTTGGNQTWKWALALVYGGLDLSNPIASGYGGTASNPQAVADCTSTVRANLVANWTNLFQNAAANSCTGNASICAGTGTVGSAVNGALWHAYRRDDDSGTSDVFASILGLSPSVSNSTVNGFGASPYCNAMNWDVSTSSTGTITSGNNAACGYGAHDQFTGPGGVIDPSSKCAYTATGAKNATATTCGAAGTGNHRKPPAGAWGENPASATAFSAWDVYPTQFQDNDPIRRKCIGIATNASALAGEEVCNIDGALGLVLPMVDTDWVPKGNLGPQFSTNKCTGQFVVGLDANVFTCAPLGVKHSAECPNGDTTFGGGCLMPIDATNGTSQCVATKSTVTALQVRSLGSPDGRIYNEQLRSGSIADGTAPYLFYKIVSLGTSVEFTAAYNRIHQVETFVPGTAYSCQLEDMDDQIGCLTQADPCSIGYAGDDSKLWYQHTGGPCVPTATSGGLPTCGPGSNSNAPPLAGLPGTDAARVAEVYPNTTTVQALGTAGEYQLSRKLYFNSVIGFGNIADTTGDTSATDELTLARDEATPSFINTLLTSNNFFELGPIPGEAAPPSPRVALAGGAANTPFCEDFNEQTVCGASSNNNGCLTNPSGVPSTVNTVCGNGVLEAFEECDPGAGSIASVNAGSGCSSTCRCVLDFNETTGVCN
jgi:hypothetical protein